MGSISVVMIVKNEVDNLPDCLESVKNIVDEMVIVDTGSTDDTREVAKKFGAKVFDYKWSNNFAEARNFALSKSKADWNLILDADEHINSWRREVVDSLTRRSRFIGKINITNKFQQGDEVRLSQIRISRLLPKGVFFTGKIHEQVNSNLPRIDLPIELYHTGYFNTDKSVRNLKILEMELAENPMNAYIIYQLARQYKTMKQFNDAVNYFRLSYKLTERAEEYFPDLVINYLYTLIDLKQFYPAFEVIEQMDAYLANSPDYQFVRGLFFMNFVLSDILGNIDFLPLIEESYLASLKLGKKGKEEIVLGTASFLAAYNLGVYYEMFNQKDKAKYYYQFSASYNYEPAKKRLFTLK